MTPKPYSDKSSLPRDSSDDVMSEMPAEAVQQTPSPETLSGATTPSPTPQEQVPVEPFVDAVNSQENNRISDISAITPCYPTPADIMPYDHSLPDFIRQITNQPNLANLQSLSLRVISTLISLHRMSAYLPNLRELDLEGSVLNSLRDIGCSLRNLQILKVGRCQLESLDGTFGLSSLRELYAQKNFINDVSPCSNLPHIRHVDVSGNRIRNISYAGFLSVCRKLRSIVFTGNPATEVPGYRSHVRRILPQVETLDGVPFASQDDTEEVLEPEPGEYSGEESDGSSEVPDLSTLGPSSSVNDLSKSPNFFLLDKRNKQAKNLANQDQSDAVDGELQETSSEAKTDSRLQDEFQIPNSQARKGLLGQVTGDNKSVNLKQNPPPYRIQTYASIQKLDKDIENRSKKSNTLMNTSFGEEIVSTQEFPKCQLSDEDNTDSPSIFSSTVGEDDQTIFPPSEEGSTEPRASGSTPNSSFQKTAEEIKYGVIKKTSSCSLGKSKQNRILLRGGETTSLTAEVSGKDEEQILDENWGTNRLTTGLPICGNLTAALRNRKKVQNGRSNESESLLRQNVPSPPEAGEERNSRGSGDAVETECGAVDEDDFFAEDVLTTSRKWRQSFRRFRSNNRASWEEEEHEDEKKGFDPDDGIRANEMQ